MVWPMVPLAATAGASGLITDGDWIVASNMDLGGTIRLIQLADVGVGTFLDRSAKFINRTKFAELGCTALQKDDVLISRMADPIGRACRVPALPYEAITAVDVTILRTDPEVADPRFIVYYCNTPEFLNTAKGAATGTTRSRVTRRNLEKIRIPLPPLSEQRRIVEILDQADRLRRLRAEANAKADRIIPAVLARTLGSPRTWGTDPRCKPLEELVEPMSGATPSKTVKRFWSGEVPWVSPKDMKRDFLLDSEDHVSASTVEEINLGMVPEGSALIVVRGMILARDVPLAINLRPVTINQDMKALIPKRREVSGAYVWAALYLARPVLQTLVRIAGHGTRKLDTPDLMRFAIPSPGSDKLNAVNAFVQHHRLAIEQRQKSNTSLERLFGVVLSNAFDGDLTSAWREAHMAELVQEMEQQAKALSEA